VLRLASDLLHVTVLIRATTISARRATFDAVDQALPLRLTLKIERSFPAYGASLLWQAGAPFWPIKATGNRKCLPCAAKRPPYRDGHTRTLMSETQEGLLGFDEFDGACWAFYPSRGGTWL
jgi:hypothetical protein